MEKLICNSRRGGAKTSSFARVVVLALAGAAGALSARAAAPESYLEYVATDDPGINASRVSERYEQGGHDVPPDKIAARYVRSLANLPSALPYLSRAFFFDNSGAEMKYLACFSEETGLDLHLPDNELPTWFRNFQKTISH